MIILYRLILGIWSLVVRVSAPFFIFFRLKANLEDPLRYKERYGLSELQRPDGDLVWFHGASVGESLSILPLIQKLLEKKPNICILVTTTTKAAQKVLNSRNNFNIIHQFIPFDSSKWVKKFLNHWQPNSVFFVESEIWPNILEELRSRHIPVTLLNARLSEKSFRNWSLIGGFAKGLWNCFSFIYTQSDLFTKKFQNLGAKNVKTIGNIKILSDPLPLDEPEFEYWKNQIGDRQCWIAASTHQGEEDTIFYTHKELKKSFPSLLTIIAPRHIERCTDILQKTKDLKITRFSSNSLEQNADILLVDCMSKLGTFYRLSPVAFIGGSLTPIGGHNPLEAVIVGSLPVWGPYSFKIEDMLYLFEGIPCQQENTDQLINRLKYLLMNPKKVTEDIQTLQSRIKISQQFIWEKINEIIKA